MAHPLAPTVDEVAAHCQARLVLRGGGNSETFTDQTKPTKAQVEKLLDDAGKRVSSKTGGTPCNDDLIADAQGTAAIYAAMLIEQSYYPGQTRDQGSSFQSLLALWKDAISDLAKAVAEQCGGQGGGDGDIGMDTRSPKATFDSCGLIGRSNPDW